jgi:hypothetical protein
MDVAAVAVGLRLGDGGPGEHARLVDGEIERAGEDVQHGQLGAEERAAGRGHSLAPGDEWLQIEAGLPDLDHVNASSY